MIITKTKEVEVTADAVRQAYPKPQSMGDSYTPGAYCIAGAFLKFLGVTTS